MDSESLRMAAELVKTHSQAGEDIRQLLLSDATTPYAAQTLEEVRQSYEAEQLREQKEQAERLFNFQVISDALALAPVEKINPSEEAHNPLENSYGNRILDNFYADDELVAKSALYHMVTTEDPHATDRIYFILGDRLVSEDGNKPQREVLLWPMKGPDGTTHAMPKIVPVHHKDWKNFGLHREETFVEKIPEHELLEHFVPKIDRISVNYTQLPFLQNRSLTLSKIYDSYYPPGLKPLSDKCSTNGNVRLAMRTKPIRLVNGITDAEIESFNVIDHLNDIASDFGIASEVSEVLRRYAEPKTSEKIVNIDKAKKFLRRIVQRIIDTTD